MYLKKLRSHELKLVNRLSSESLLSKVNNKSIILIIFIVRFKLISRGVTFYGKILLSDNRK